MMNISRCSSYQSSCQHGMITWIANLHPMTAIANLHPMTSIANLHLMSWIANLHPMSGHEVAWPYPLQSRNQPCIRVGYINATVVCVCARPALWLIASTSASYMTSWQANLERVGIRVQLYQRQGTTPYTILQPQTVPPETLSCSPGTAPPDPRRGTRVAPAGPPPNC